MPKGIKRVSPDEVKEFFRLYEKEDLEEKIANLEEKISNRKTKKEEYAEELKDAKNTINGLEAK